ncbi:DUF7059 domain-containing protein [Arthrobacter castelli]|uniref:DUF7059 domain-containing protein n=1 Tax=Arthrobacter castelli TaxID=271431 RepID=UPI00041FBDB8|nr:methyltransferase [Arthrobacter castelli]
MSVSRNSTTVPHSGNLQLLKALEAGLRQVDYTVEGVEALLGQAANEALHRDQLVPALLVTRQLAAESNHRLAAVVRLWMLGSVVSGAELDAALPGTGAAGLAAMGLIEEYDGGWRGTVDLRPYGTDGGPQFWVASDPGAVQRPGVLRQDHVLGVGQASLNLAQFVDRRPVDRALDLGTGCGIQLFHLLNHARHVVATDISERALAVTRFNLMLNAAALELDPSDLESRVELRRGNMLDPVAGERFDLVVSNPPFVITPRHGSGADDNRFVYRDGGLAGDEIVASLIRAVPNMLSPGGTAQLLGNWEIRHDGSWDQRIRQWVPEGVDAWVIQREQVPPAEYAGIWLRDAAEERDQEQYIRSFADYLADFESRDVAAVGLGMVWLRKPDGGTSIVQRCEEIQHSIEQPIGPAIAASVARGDWLAARSDEALRHEYLVVAPDVTEERHQRPGAEHPGVILLRQGAGFRRTTLLSSELAGFVSVCDGELTAGQILTALGALLEPEGEDFEAGLLSRARELVRDGFLIPAAFETGRDDGDDRDDGAPAAIQADGDGPQEPFQADGSAAASTD